MILFNALQQSLLFLPLCLGIYLSYAYLKTTDMTTEGSFVLGAAIFAKLSSLGLNILISGAIALLAGCLSGALVSVIQARNRINPLIAGIIALFILYTINFQVMGRPNIGLHHITPISNASLLLIIGALLCIYGIIISSRMGLLLRAFGSNTQLLEKLGKNIEGYRLFGFCLSNLLASFCGVITAIASGYADLNMGFGMTLTGIGTVVIGTQILNTLENRYGILKCKPFFEIICTFFGVYLYFLCINLFLFFGLDAIYLKLALGLLLIFLLRGKLK